MFPASHPSAHENREIQEERGIPDFLLVRVQRLYVKIADVLLYTRGENLGPRLCVYWSYVYTHFILENMFST